MTPLEYFQNVARVLFVSTILPPVILGVLFQVAVVVIDGMSQINEWFEEQRGD